MAQPAHAIRNGIVAAALAALNVWPSQAETIDIIEDHGGSGINYVARWTQYRRDKVRVRIAGPCESECTMVAISTVNIFVSRRKAVLASASPICRAGQGRSGDLTRPTSKSGSAGTAA